MKPRTVHIEAGVPLAATHRAALGTLPLHFAVTDDALTADVLAGSAAFLREQLVSGARARVAVLVAPRSEAWDDVDALWAAVEYRDVSVVPASIDVAAIAPLAEQAAAIIDGPSPFLAEIHLESLGVEETRLAQVVSLLDAIGLTCPQVEVRKTANGWVATAEDERMTLRAHCVASAALSPRIRVRLTSATQQFAVDLPMGPDARPLITTARTATGTHTVTGPYESPARAFWRALP